MLHQARASALSAANGSRVSYIQSDEGSERSEPSSSEQKWLEQRTGATGLEPATSGVTGRRSNQLNYAPVVAEV